MKHNNRKEVHRCSPSRRVLDAESTSDGDEVWRCRRCGSLNAWRRTRSGRLEFVGPKLLYNAREVLAIPPGTLR